MKLTLGRLSRGWSLPLLLIFALSPVVSPVVSPVAARAADEARGTPYRDLYSDTWVAVDGLNRRTPDISVVGPPRQDRIVGMFYFLTFDQNQEGPYDNSKILKAHPEAIEDILNPAWGPLNTAHYWGEPLFGYYVSDDAYVLRKHALMLADAGVDVVIFDNSNAVTYDRARNALCDIWEEMRRSGLRTPQIAFLCPFGNPNHMGSSTLGELYDSIYAPGKYRDLWFLWKGKPLVLAYRNYTDDAAPLLHTPAKLATGETLGQAFVAKRPFTSVGGEFPTWATTDSGFALTLYSNGPGGRLLARASFQNVADNAAQFVTVNRAMPSGRYYLEMSRGVGRVGWWGYPSDVYSAGQAFQSGRPTSGDRALIVRYAGDDQLTTLSPEPDKLAAGAGARRARKMHDFFTFRSPIAPYDVMNPPADSWAWLQVYPQAPQRDLDGKVEQVTVGVAQNYNLTVKRAAPMSWPGAFGRSYHDGREDTRPDAVWYGFNFAEQWKRAREIDPPFVFITGWNEWTAGFYNNWSSWTAPPPIFVDEFNEEYSRDIEPMRGGHGDDYYYQLVDNVRRYKGVRRLPAVVPRPITINAAGGFRDWAAVQPEFRDAVGDTVHRNAPGFGKSGPYTNTTGRNDIVAAKVSCDAANVYFYVRTKDTLTPHTDPNWMLLFLNTDSNYKTGWLGYDYVVNRHVGDHTASLERCTGNGYSWTHVAEVKYAARGNELELAIPRSAIGVRRLLATIDFKWADNCIHDKDWTDFTLYGDAAPDDRFNYRAILGAPAK